MSLKKSKHNEVETFRIKIYLNTRLCGTTIYFNYIQLKIFVKPTLLSPLTRHLYIYSYTIYVKILLSYLEHDLRYIKYCIPRMYNNSVVTPNTNVRPMYMLCASRRKIAQKHSTCHVSLKYWTYQGYRKTTTQPLNNIRVHTIHTPHITHCVYRTKHADWTHYCNHVTHMLH